MVSLFIASLGVLPTADATASELSKGNKAQANVILVRGGFNIFSEGLDSISAQLAARGVSSTVYRHRQSDEIVQAILKNQHENGRSPIILVGHSWGANAILKVAKTLKAHRLKVRYMVTFAATNPTRASANIQELTNYYFQTGGWGKAVRAAADFKGRLHNVDMSGEADVHHFNVDELPRLQAQVVSKIIRLVRGRKFAESNQTPG
jgi:hypothetical protein